MYIESQGGQNKARGTSCVERVYQYYQLCIRERERERERGREGGKRGRNNKDVILVSVLGGKGGILHTLSIFET